ncbi:MAG: conjugal transfer protein TraX [Lachnospiraceae bacterium]|nr:conjugal transfer protein TraX [Ruminococcus sp.]MCM1274762.1 conjugal transfer protein TraX [Lachnospiraceae bacterium]
MTKKRRKTIPLTIPVCSANFMKMLGTVLLTVYFFAQSVIQNGVLDMPNLTAQQLAELVENDYDAFMFSGMASVCFLIGAAAIPIFAFLLTEGIQKTSGVKRYILTVLAAAVLTEIPYDYAVSGKFFNWGDQNFLWTLLISLIMLWLLKTFQGKGAAAVIIDLMITAGGCVWAILFKSRFGAGFVLITAILFLLREHKGVSIFLGVAVSLIYISAPLGFIPVALYSGERKNLDKKTSKYGYYVFCPVIALFFALTANLVVHSI